MSEEPARWSQPFAALLGAYAAQMGFGLPLHRRKGQHVRNLQRRGARGDQRAPTLVSFAVDVAKQQDIITPEFKRPGSKIVLLSIEKDEYDLPCYHRILESYGKLRQDIKAGRIISAYAVERHGMAEAGEQDGLRKPPGREDRAHVDPRDFFAPDGGNLVCEVPDGMVGQLAITYTVIGEVTDRGVLEYGNVSISLDEAIEAWCGTLEKVFPHPLRREGGEGGERPVPGGRPSPSAATSWDSPRCSSPCSPAPTVSTTALGPSSGPEPGW